MKINKKVSSNKNIFSCSGRKKKEFNSFIYVTELQHQSTIDIIYCGGTTFTMIF